MPPAVSSGRRTSLGLFFLEVFLIVLGVVLGLAANEWRVASRQRRDAEDLLEQIASEIRRNQTQIQEIVAYHEAVAETLRALLLKADREPGFSISYVEMHEAMPRGFVVPLMATDAWQLARTTGAVRHMDRQIALTLARLYAAQAFYQKKLDRIGDNLYIARNMDPEAVRGLVLALGALANDIVIQERRLLEAYEEILPKLPAP
jgi:hypothetical protein